MLFVLRIPTKMNRVGVGFVLCLHIFILNTTGEIANLTAAEMSYFTLNTDFKGNFVKHIVY